MKRYFLLCLSALFGFGLQGQFDKNQFIDAMRWRMIGPHRGGRTVGAVGVPQQSNVFYIGVNNGGVWKTSDFGRTWVPTFDAQPTGSIGDVAVAPSDPNILYAGSGEGLQRPDLSVGKGMYKSGNAGRTWFYIGLPEVQQIGGLAIDPLDANKVFVAALGRPYGANEERGVYRTVDGGNSWQKVLYVDENTGAVQVTLDPNNPQIVFATLWAARLAPWENGMWSGKGSGLYKSIDGGNTWIKITKGLPTVEQGLGRIGFCIAPSDSKRMYATVDAGAEGGIYRSEDAGESWTRIQTDERYWGRGTDFAEIKVDPKNPDIVYSANIVVWKSTDGGKSWFAFRGAPGGDDYHRIWINPTNPDIILLAGDQGAIITVNGGETFSSWYNQPTAQFYHVSTDNAFPYNVYSGQQESGSIGIASRGNDGGITFREWHSVGAQEYGYVAADPLDPNIIYGGKLTRHDKRTGQTQNISPEIIGTGKYRFIRTAPVLFNPVDKKTLYYAGNVIFKTKNGGNSWKIISPDLSRESWDIPANVGIYTNEEMKTMPRRGVVYTVAPSYTKVNTIWCGTDDGLIHVTRNGGKTWENVTPKEITAWSKISLMDASHFDDNTAFAAVNRIRCDDMRPHIYKTNDGGKTWKEIVRGLPTDPINVVREDPLRKGLLYAGSETAVYYSLDAGENWQSLRLNMPATSIRDLVIKDDDLVIATHGRSFWILDDITPIRQLADSFSKLNTLLFKPQKAYRVRWNMNTDTPVPQEEPAGENPPEGAIINYYLRKDVAEIKLEIRDAKNNLIRSYSNLDTFYKIPQGNVPPYWIRRQIKLPTSAGSHRFMWDMHYQPLNERVSYPMGATYFNTDPDPNSPYVMPGMYTAVLLVDGKKHVQKFDIVMDPRVKTTLANLQKQHDASLQCYRNIMSTNQLVEMIHGIQSEIAKLMEIGPDTLFEKRQEISTQFGYLVHAKKGSGEYDANYLKAGFAAIMNVLQESDMNPTSQALHDIVELEKKMQFLKMQFEQLKLKISLK